MALATPAAGQSRATVLRERAEYEAWLRQSAESPLPTATRQSTPLAWYSYDPGLVFLAPLQPARSGHLFQVVADDGRLMDVTEAGTFVLGVGGVISRLTVWRLPPTAEGEPGFEAHFLDATNGGETSGAGRFVPLIALGGNRFLLDLNRARQPWCAYAAALPCPPALQASPIGAPIRAGERLHPTP